MKLVALLMTGLCINNSLNAMPKPDTKESHEALAYQAIEIPSVGSTNGEYDAKNALEKIKRRISIDKIENVDLILGIGAIKALYSKLNLELRGFQDKIDAEKQKIDSLQGNISSQVKTSAEQSLAKIKSLMQSIKENRNKVTEYYTDEELTEEQEWRKEQEALADYNRCARWCLTRNRRCCCSNGAILKWMGITIGGMLLPVIVVGLPMWAAEQAN